jgi:Domain of unknown function (DUF1707)/Cell wall-active antibiotics response 4TMS YvqF
VVYREPGMEDRPDLPAIRASDDERERSIVLLRDAVVSGRLTLEEFSDRVGRAQVALTDRDLAELTVDLPAHAPVPALVTHAKHRAICSKLVRRGSWEIPERSSWRSLFGTILLDLREARLAGPVVDMDIHNTFGTVTVLVPAGVQLDVEGTAPFASQVIEPPSRPPPPGAPRLRIRTKGPGGTLHVRAPDHD